MTSGFQCPTIARTATCKPENHKHCILQYPIRGQFEQPLIYIWHKVCDRNPVRACLKQPLLFVVVLATGLVAPGCNKSAENARGPVPTKLDYNYPYDKREVFIDDANADLTELDQKIRELAETVTNASTAVKATAQPKIEVLRQQRVALGAKLEVLKDAKETNWNELKADYQKASSQMKASLGESLKWVQDNART